MKAGPSTRATRLNGVRKAILARAEQPAVARDAVPRALIAAVDEEAAAALARGEPATDARRAIHNRGEVARMSLSGTPVAQIAATLGLSYRHVVAIRSELDVGRRR